MRTRFKITLAVAFFLGLFVVLGVQTAHAAGLFSPDVTFFPGINIEVGAQDDPQGVVATLQVLFLFSIIALAPSLLVLLTAFTRIVIILSFTRQAMATQQMPPNQVLVGIALFMTMFIMAPQLDAINQNAIIPFGAGEINAEQAIEYAWEPLRDFMLRQLDGSEVGERSVGLFMDMADLQVYYPEDIPPSVLIPSFILNELTLAFLFGFAIYLPFIVIDMVVASILMSMGMMMLPPAMISLPFKIMVFILVGGWQRIVEGMLLTFT